MQTENFQIRVVKRRPEVFEQVIRYVLDRVGAKPNVGETVLHKLFYFVDFDYFEKFEESLMGETYIKNNFGPTCVNLVRILDRMERNGEVKKTERQYHSYVQRKYLIDGQRKPASLSTHEIEHIDGVLDRLSDMSATELSEYSHNDVPWKCAEFGEPIKYEHVFYRDDDYSVKDYDDDI